MGFEQSALRSHKAAQPPARWGLGGCCYDGSAATGDDKNGDGSFSAPWPSLANVVSYDGTPGE